MLVGGPGDIGKQSCSVKRFDLNVDEEDAV